VQFIEHADYTVRDTSLLLYLAVADPKILKGGRQSISLVVIMQMHTTNYICLLYGKGGLLQIFLDQ